MYNSYVIGTVCIIGRQVALVMWHDNFEFCFVVFNVFWYPGCLSRRVSMTTWFLWFCHAKFDNICGDFLCVGLASASCLLTTISPKRNKKTVQIKSWFFIWTCLLQIIMLQYHYIVQSYKQCATFCSVIIITKLQCALKLTRICLMNASTLFTYNDEWFSQ